jgi:hypothetical protein
LIPAGAVSFKNKGGKVRSGNGEMTRKIQVWREISCPGKGKTARKIPVYWEISRMWRENIFPMKFPLPSYANFLTLGGTYSSSTLFTNGGWKLA